MSEEGMGHGPDITIRCGKINTNFIFVKLTYSVKGVLDNNKWELAQ